MHLDDWLEHARRDASRRGLPDLAPLLDMLFRATRALRAADRARAGDDRAAGNDAGPAVPAAPPEDTR